MDDVALRETRQRIVRWIGDSKHLHDLLPGLLDEYERLQGRAETVERECERLRQEISDLRRENDFFRTERAEIAEAVSKLINVQLVSEILQKLGATRAGSPGNPDTGTLPLKHPTLGFMQK